eukprot:scaffold312419_cov16-Tisochrysis_lutea.AAC.1
MRFCFHSVTINTGLGVSTDQLPPDLTLLPNTAVHAIFCNLDATDKRNFVCGHQGVSLCLQIPKSRMEVPLRPLHGYCGACLVHVSLALVLICLS